MAPDVRTLAGVRRRRAWARQHVAMAAASRGCARLGAAMTEFGHTHGTTARAMVDLGDAVQDQLLTELVDRMWNAA